MAPCPQHSAVTQHKLHRRRGSCSPLSDLFPSYQQCCQHLFHDITHRWPQHCPGKHGISWNSPHLLPALLCSLTPKGTLPQAGTTQPWPGQCMAPGAEHSSERPCWDLNAQKKVTANLPLLLLLLSMKPAILFVSETKDQLNSSTFNKH